MVCFWKSFWWNLIWRPTPLSVTWLSHKAIALHFYWVIDEAHELTLHTDILFGLVKDLAREREDLKVIISSATLDAEKFSNFFDDAPIFRVPGRTHRVEVYHTKNPEADYINACIVTIMQVFFLQNIYLPFVSYLRFTSLKYIMRLWEIYLYFWMVKMKSKQWKIFSKIRLLSLGRRSKNWSYFRFMRIFHLIDKHWFLTKLHQVKEFLKTTFFLKRHWDSVEGIFSRKLKVLVPKENICEENLSLKVKIFKKKNFFRSNLKFRVQGKIQVPKLPP